MVNAVFKGPSFTNKQPGRMRRQVFDLQDAFALAKIFTAPEIGNAARTRQRDRDSLRMIFPIEDANDSRVRHVDDADAQ